MNQYILKELKYLHYLGKFSNDEILNKIDKSYKSF